MSAVAAEVLGPEEEELEPALLSLPQADSVSAASAAMDSVVPNALPMLLSFTYSHFLRGLLTGFRLPGNVCGRSRRLWHGR